MGKLKNQCRLSEKAKTDNRDTYLSLSEYCNIVISDIGLPAQLSMNRRLSSVLPCTPEQLTPKVISSRKVMESLRQAQGVITEV